jgi:hypothetical protein
MGMRWRFVLVALPLLALMGCGNTSNTRLPVACPRPGILAEGADLTRYRPGAVRDLTTLEWDARIGGISGGCNPGRKNLSIDMTLIASFTIERGAGAEGRVIDLPWFVAVVENGTEQVLARRSFTERVTFARNETKTNVETVPVSLTLPVGESRRGNDYRIYVSFELTPEDFALNRRRGPR